MQTTQLHSTIHKHLKNVEENWIFMPLSGHLNNSVPFSLSNWKQVKITYVHYVYSLILSTLQSLLYVDLYAVQLQFLLCIIFDKLRRGCPSLVCTHSQIKMTAFKSFQIIIKKSNVRKLSFLLAVLWWSNI